ncbi:MAG: ketoacyl-ACP synthase III [Thiohalomonadaceae bacterium]
MIGISAVAPYIPGQSINNLERLDAFQVSREFVCDKTGFVSVAIKGEDEETSDLCVKAYRNLQHKTDIDISAIDCIIVCTQNPDAAGLPHTSAIVHGKLGGGTACASFDVSLGCSGYVYGLSVAKAFMEANSYKKGLLFTADPYSKIVDQTDKNTALLFGDAATVTLLTENPTWSIGACEFGTFGQQSDVIRRTGSLGKLDMNGRGVFTLAAKYIPGSIMSTLEKNHLILADIDLFVLHQGSKYIVDTLAEKLGVERDKAPFAAGSYGNTVSSSIPLLLENVPAGARRILLSGFGVGFSWANTVLTRTGDDYERHQ